MDEVSDLHLVSSSPTYQEEFLQYSQFCFHITVPRELCEDLPDHVWQERRQRHSPEVLHSTCKGNPAHYKEKTGQKCMTLHKFATSPAKYQLYCCPSHSMQWLIAHLSRPKSIG